MKYADIADMPEDDRIRQIGEKVMRERMTVAFVTDAEHGKADRYISKLQKRFPGIRVIARGDGPVAETEWVKVGPPLNIEELMDKIAGYLEVGINDAGEIIVNHPKPMELDAEGRGHFVFSANQARHLAELLLRKASEVEVEMRRKKEQAAYEAAAKVPVDRSARMLADGSPETPDHREIDPASGQQKGYIVLSAAERAKGFVRPVRRSYRHLKCGTVTTMGQSIAETYARDPGFYSGTFCCECRKHLPLDEFVWEGTNEKVGS